MLDDAKRIKTDEFSFLKSQVFPNIEDGSLLVVTVGSEKTPATTSDMQRVADNINEVFEGAKGVSILVIPHLVKVERLSLPALRNIQSRVVDSWNSQNPPCIDINVLGEFGDT